MIQILATITIAMALMWLLAEYCERVFTSWAGRVLGAVKVLGDGTTPLAIYHCLEGAGRGLSLVAIYKGLERLEELGLVHTWTEPGGAKRGFREQRKVSYIGDL